MSVRILRRLIFPLWLCFFPFLAFASDGWRVVDVPSRPGVTQRILYKKPDQPKSVVVLFAGGDGGIGIGSDGKLRKGGNFLVRSRSVFADQGAAVAVIDAPSDRQSYPFLDGFRESKKHAADIKAVIDWLRRDSGRPVWLIGTSRGTISVAYLAIELASDSGPDGIVLTSTVLDDHRGGSVPPMPLERIRIPVLVVHHENDGCHVCRFSDMPRLTKKLSNSSRHELITFTGGKDKGNPCQARSYHGFNGIEPEVIAKIMSWVHAASSAPTVSGKNSAR